MTSFSSDRRLFLFSRERTAIFWCSSNVSHFCGVIRWYNRDIRLQSLGVSTSANVIIVCFIRGRSEVLPSRFVFYVLFRQSSPWLNIEREVFHTYIFSIILLDFDFNNEGEDIFAAIGKLSIFSILNIIETLIYLDGISWYKILIFELLSF